MTRYMKMGFVYGALILLPLVFLTSLNPFLGLLAIALFGAWFWNLTPPDNMDADLKTSNEAIEKELPENPHTGELTYLVDEAPIAPAKEEEPDPQPWLP